MKSLKKTACHTARIWLAGLVITGLCTTTIAQDIWVDRLVWPKENARLRISSQEVSWSLGWLPLKVERVNDDWLWVGVAWVSKNQVVLDRDAMSYYTRYLARNPSSSWGYNIRAILHKRAKHYDAALADLNQAIRLDPNNGAAYVNRADVYFQKDDYDSQYRDLKTAVRVEPRNASVHMAMADYWYEDILWAYESFEDPEPKSIQTAIHHYTRAISLEPKHKAAYIARGDLYYDLEKHEQAVSDYTSALNIPPARHEDYARRAQLRKEMGKYDKALDDFTKAARICEEDSSNEKLLVGYLREQAEILATCLDASVRDGQRAIDIATEVGEICGWSSYGDMKRLAAAHAEAGDFESAITWTLKWTNQFNFRHDIPVMDLYRNKVPLREGSDEDYVKALQKAPDAVAVYLNRGRTLTEPEKAIVDFDKVLEMDSKNVAAYLLRGRAWSTKGELDKAIADYTEAIRLDPQYKNAYAYRGSCWYSKSEYDKAIADYTEFIRLDPQYNLAYMRRGGVWRKKGEFDKAIEDYTQAIRLKAVYVSAYASRASVFKAKGEYDKAIADYDQAIRLTSKTPSSCGRHYGSRGDVWFAKKEYDRALEDYDRQLNLLPKHAGAHYMRGRCWQAKEELDKAMKAYNEALRLNPKYVWPHYYRAKLWNKQGEYEKAIADYTHAVQLEPKSALPANSLAWLLATCPDSECRNGTKAVEHAERACELTNWKDPYKLGTLAAANAEVGEFQKAVEYQNKALEIAGEGYDKEAAQERLELYKAGKPYREPRSPSLPRR